jgi:hypothetical protein
MLYSQPPDRSHHHARIDFIISIVVVGRRELSRLLFGLPSNPENRYYSHKFGVHMGNVR